MHLRPSRTYVIRSLPAGLAVVLALLPVAAWPSDFEVVELDTSSGVFAKRLPFDVPFVVAGLSGLDTSPSASRGLVFSPSM